MAVKLCARVELHCSLQKMARCNECVVLAAIGTAPSSLVQGSMIHVVCLVPWDLRDGGACTWVCVSLPGLDCVCDAPGHGMKVRTMSVLCAYGSAMTALK